MQELLHLIGICPDSGAHFSLTKLFFLGTENILAILNYIKHLIK